MKLFMIFLILTLVVYCNSNFILIHLKHRPNEVKARNDNIDDNRHEDLNQGFDYINNPVELADQDYKGYDDYFGKIIVYGYA